MGKFFKILGIVFLVIILVVAGLLIWAYYAGSDMQKEFFTALTSGDAASVKAMMHPKLSNTMDDPVLDQYMKAFKNHFGEFKKLSKSNFSTSVDHKDGNKYTESKGTVIFEKGETQSRLKFIDDKIVEFSVEDDALGTDWLDGLDTTFYRNRGESFYKEIGEKQIEAAHQSMHENLQAVLPLDKLKLQLAAFFEKHGLIEKITFLAEKYTPGKLPELAIWYKITTSKSGDLPAAIRFKFIGMKGHIIEFAIPTSVPPPAAE